MQDVQINSWKIQALTFCTPDASFVHKRHISPAELKNIWKGQ